MYKRQPKQPAALLEHDEFDADTELFKLALSDANHVQTANVIQSAALDEADELDTNAEKSDRLDKPIVVVRPSPLRSFFWFVIGMVVGALGLLIYAWNREEITTFVTNAIAWVQTFI